MKIIPPGSTLGILGGGQLGRMIALAAARLGYRCHVFCPEDDAPALQVCAAHTRGNFDDAVALAVFAGAVDVVTLEWENVPVAAVELLAARKPVHPGAAVLRVAQDRVREKSFAREFGIGTADFVAVRHEQDLAAALKSFALPAILKATQGGYDGKGQARLEAGTNPAAAWRAIGGGPAILEAFVAFEREISVIVARRVDGVAAAYPAVENTHRHHVLAETLAPARLVPAVAREAETIALHLAERLGVVGLLAVEMFVLAAPNAAGQRVLVNEIAPRPHNSGHWTIDACACSQFEQLVRAVCGLPLGSTVPHSRAVMHNLLGDEAGRWAELLANPQACLHLYGKTEARPGRKMGHVTLLGERWPQG